MHIYVTLLSDSQLLNIYTGLIHRTVRMLLFLRTARRLHINLLYNIIVKYFHKIICDPPSENQPSSHLVVFQEILF